MLYNCRLRWLGEPKDNIFKTPLITNLVAPKFYGVVCFIAQKSQLPVLNCPLDIVIDGQIEMLVQRVPQIAPLPILDVFSPRTIHT